MRRLSQLRTSAVVGAALLIGLPLAAAAQAPTTAPPPTATQASGAPADQSPSDGTLDGARRALDRVNGSSLSGEAATKFAELRRNFSDLATATGSSAVGAGSTPQPGQMGTEWRAKYTMVDNTVLGLIGSSTNAAPSDAVGTPGAGTGVANLDATVRGQLQEFRSQLQMFYARQMGQAPQPAPSTTSNGADVLLDRMASIIDDALAGRPGTSRAVGTSGTKGSLASAGMVTIERQRLDEIRAEIAQLRAMLKVEKP